MNDAYRVITNLDWRRTIRVWVIGIVACSLIAVFLSFQWFVNPATDNSIERWKLIIGHYLVVVYVWGLLTIAIVPVTALVGLDRNRWLKSGLTYLAIGIAFSVAHMLITSLVIWVLSLFTGQLNPGHRLSPVMLLGSLQSNLIIFTVIASVCLALNYYRKFKDRELRATRLEAQLTKAQLDTLKAQLQPHFLFNTLNAISALVRDNPAAAERMIVQLSDLLRSTLDNGETEEVTLRDEMNIVERFLEIEKMRFGDRLIVEQRIDPRAENALVPTLILQPLVENAMRHGVANVSSSCQVAISAERSNGKLILDVVDTGPGQVNQDNSTGGLGLNNTIDRLRHLYGEDFRFTATNRETGGFGVHMEIPFRQASGVNLKQGGG